MLRYQLWLQYLRVKDKTARHAHDPHARTHTHTHTWLHFHFLLWADNTKFTVARKTLRDQLEQTSFSSSCFNHSGNLNNLQHVDQVAPAKQTTNLHKNPWFSSIKVKPVTLEDCEKKPWPQVFRCHTAVLLLSLPVNYSGHWTQTRTNLSHPSPDWFIWGCKHLPEIEKQAVMLAGLSTLGFLRNMVVGEAVSSVASVCQFIGHVETVRHCDFVNPWVTGAEFGTKHLYPNTNKEASLSQVFSFLLPKCFYTIKCAGGELGTFHRRSVWVWTSTVQDGSRVGVRTLLCAQNINVLE